MTDTMGYLYFSQNGHKANVAICYYSFMQNTVGFKILSSILNGLNSA